MHQRNSNFFKNSQETNPLLQAVVDGQQDIVENIIAANPQVMFEKTSAIDCLGRRIECSPYQAALRDRDTDMLKMMAPYITDLDLAATQRDEQYPNGIEDQSAFNFKAILDSIKRSSNTEVQAALNKQENDSPLCRALNTFRKQFTAVAMNDKNFNPQHLLKAFEAHDTEFNETSSRGMRVLFWRQVIGFIQLFLPVCDRQAIAQGIYFLIVQNEKLKRDLAFRSCKGKEKFPIANDLSHSGLGFDWAVGDLGDRDAILHIDQSYSWKTYIENKHQAFKTLYRPASGYQLRK